MSTAITSCNPPAAPLAFISSANPHFFSGSIA